MGVMRLAREGKARRTNHNMLIEALAGNTALRSRLWLRADQDMYHVRVDTVGFGL